MKIPKLPFDNSRVANQTWVQRSHADAIIARAKTITEDSGRQFRLEVQECPICWENGKVGGTACTTKECDLCGVEMRFGNTCYDRLCLTCAKSIGVCRHCGADIDLKQRKKLWIKKETE